MHEYEFRLVVEDSSPFRLEGLTLHESVVTYVHPHFRFRNGLVETKRIESTHAVYHDGLWFRWVHSIETPYRAWSTSTCETFLHNMGNFQDPFRHEKRLLCTLDAHAQLYTFQKGIGCYRLVFEWEYGTFKKPKTRFDPNVLLAALSQYKPFYDRLRPFPAPRYTLNEAMTRRTVTCVASMPEGDDRYLYAPKWDGTFGLVHSYRDRIKEKWEGYECVVRNNATLGDGLVLAAEKMEGGRVILLDVYQVRGHETAGWCRRAILTEFLPSLRLIQGYSIQAYTSQPSPEPPAFPVDGVIIHNVVEDVIFKVKTHPSIDLVHYKGYFYMPNGRFQCSVQGLEEGHVYEISTEDGSVVRPRPDRFRGNTEAQVEAVLKNGWHGPPIEPLPVVGKVKRKRV